VSTRYKFLFVSLVLLAALIAPAAQTHASSNPPFFPPFDDGSGGTCATRCSDGSWSSIACNAGEQAHCDCTGSPLLANPSCK
jgi:hypothetical protein